MINKKELFLKVSILICLILCFVEAINIFGGGNFLQLFSKNNTLIQTPSISQLSSVPGQPITWTAKISASVINSGQHLLTLPQTVGKVRIIPVSATNSTKATVSTNTLTKADRLNLSKIANQNVNSQASLALSASLKKQAAQKAQTLAYNQSFASKSIAGKLTASVWNSFSNIASLMTAAVEDAIIPTDTTPAPETTVVDVAPVTDTPVTETSADTASTNTTDEQIASTSTDDSVTSPANNPSVDTTTTSSTTKDGLIIPTTTTTPAVIPAQIRPLNTDVLVEYQTPTPVIAEATTDTGKIVTITDSVSDVSGMPHTTNVLAFTNIPELYKVGQESKIKIKWLNNNDQDVTFHAYDLNNNGKIDYVEWTVPHLSTQTFEIIFISKALELDENNEVVGDIYDQVKTQDGDWATVLSGHTIQVTFEKFLTNQNDNTLYARTSGTSTSSKIEVFPVYDGTESLTAVATFDTIDTARTYKVLLTDLPKSTNTFDLKITGDVDVDYIVDPTPVTVTDTFTDTTKIASAVNTVVDTVNGQVYLAAVASWTCGLPILDLRDSKAYNTVLIGAQCWMQQNLNVGTKVNGGVVQGVSTTSIKKYCYLNDENNCTSYGGLYQWDQAMGGGSTESVQGICPTNWHLPSSDEFTTLERAVCTSGSCVSDFQYGTMFGGWKGTNEGTTLASSTRLFKLLMAGTSNGAGSMSGLGTVASLWLSSQSGGLGGDRFFDTSHAVIYRGTNAKTDVYSIRCLKN